MAVRVRWQNLGEFRHALLTTPAGLTADAEPLIRAATQGAAAAVRAAYPVGPTGNLRKGVRYRVVRGGPFSVIGQVASAAPHVFIYERGTKKRRTKKGANRGVSLPHPTFIPRMQQARAALNDQLIALLDQYGLVIHHAA